ncbi:UvrD-helicase domain-containing protein [Marinirhabdus gelatinilytica]|uniref:UvrD-helicase domain-containing protein n=1 Tax=Marinirhabdus gelatinilytica TaxID=1703343 RepID=UPI001B87E116|nr:UvrD-helicase domain-containing protein [Marinirhabdus gelatinilytica]
MPFQIYNASAGSGKTFTLVKLYLKQLITAHRDDGYKNMLAITFTNKAVAEMKQRIVEALVEFSEDFDEKDPPVMLTQIAAETNLDILQLQQKAKRVLTHLLHHYAHFSVETIDHFNHRLIRTFARDLKLPAHFEVSLDTPQLIMEAVDQLIAKAGEDRAITKLLIRFALQKTDEDKSWDVARDIAGAASLLLSENDAAHLKKLETATLEDFQDFEKSIRNKRDEKLTAVSILAQDTLSLITEAGLEKNDFSGGNRAYFPSYLEKLAAQDLGVSYGAAWQETLGEKPMYPTSKTPDHIADTIDGITSQLVAVFQHTKHLVSEIWLYDNIVKNLVPLSVINLVQQEFEALKEQYNVLPISEFNTIIHKEIKDQPAPFIYERLGDRYRHFFIDEFQDTSLLQWQNLIPLIDNALSQQFEDQEQGTLLLVGDAKQSIYRWRGGLPEQFMNLYENVNPFAIQEKKVENLETNYRSCEEVIGFNNQFFSFIQQYFGNPVHGNLYEIGNKQKHNTKENGYVQLEFIDAENKEHAHKLYGEQVRETITKLTQNEYAPEEICILCRTKSNGIALSTYLMEHGIDVVSSETLLLQFSPLVQCIINTLTFAVFPTHETAKVSFLEFVHDTFNIKTQKHDFLVELLPLEDVQFTEGLKKYGIYFSVAEVNTKSLYQTCEYIISALQLHKRADAYLFTFMDFVLDFENNPQAGKINFLEHWEQKKGTASIPSGNTQGAVQVMTIHKSKGLEFPVVLFPYADTDIYGEIDPKTWFPINHEPLEEALINYKNEVANYGEAGQLIYTERRNTLELDNYNLLYVTLTRAVEQLYIYAEKPSRQISDPPKNFGQTLIAFLQHKGMWQDSQTVYRFGNAEATATSRPRETEKQHLISEEPIFITSRPENHQLNVASAEALLWENETEVAIDFGNLLHDTMEKIRTRKDIVSVFENYRKRSILPSEKLAALQTTVATITNHPEVSFLFDDSLDTSSIFNERDIVTKDHQLMRPDRLNFMDTKKVVVTDYKTGTPLEKHKTQLTAYAQSLQDMGFVVTLKVLIYVNGDTISINKI